MLQVNNPYGSESGVPGGGRYLRAGKNVLFNKNQAFFDERETLVQCCVTTACDSVGRPNRKN